MPPRLHDGLAPANTRYFLTTGILLALLILSFLWSTGPSTSSSILIQRLQASEDLYQRTKRKRDAWLDTMGGPERAWAWPFQQAPGGQPRYYGTPWDAFPPSFNCPAQKERLGVLYDGGKWMCGIEELARKAKPIVYSMGINDQSDWEADMLERTNSELYGYDFSVTEFGPEIENRPDFKARSHFNAFRIGGEDIHDATPPQYTLSGLMQRFGHDFIDVLKIDIESYEFQLFDAILADYRDRPLPFGQLQIEIHANLQTFSSFYRWMSALDDHGLRPFSSEANLLATQSGIPPFLVEYSYVNVRHPLSLFYLPGA